MCIVYDDYLQGSSQEHRYRECGVGKKRKFIYSCVSLLGETLGEVNNTTDTGLRSLGEVNHVGCTTYKKIEEWTL